MIFTVGNRCTAKIEDDRLYMFWTDIINKDNPNVEYKSILPLVDTMIEDSFNWKMHRQSIYFNWRDQLYEVNLLEGKLIKATPSLMHGDISKEEFCLYFGNFLSQFRTVLPYVISDHIVLEQNYLFERLCPKIDNRGVPCNVSLIRDMIYNKISNSSKFYTIPKGRYMIQDQDWTVVLDSKSYRAFKIPLDIEGKRSADSYIVYDCITSLMINLENDIYT